MTGASDHSPILVQLEMPEVKQFDQGRIIMNKEKAAAYIESSLAVQYDFSAKTSLKVWSNSLGLQRLAFISVPRRERQATSQANGFLDFSTRNSENSRDFATRHIGEVTGIN